MSYTVRSSEQTRSSGAEYETKALLYLMNFREDSDDIHYFVVDFFNDLTGMSRYADKLWDLQSKATKNNSPNAVGRGLVTLFKNFLSDFDFEHLILFLGGVSSTVRLNDKLFVFDISNIKTTALKKLKEGLKSEAKEKKYIDNVYITEDNIDAFLQRVLFVVDDKTPEEYVKAIIKNHPAIIPETQILNAIFNEIKDTQACLKNTPVEGVVIQTSDEVLRYCRDLKSSEIRLMTLNRIINRNPVEKRGVPTSFISFYNSWVPEKQRDKLDQCVQTLCRALFNKNAASEFWSLFENIYSIIIENPTIDVKGIYDRIDIEKRDASPDFDYLSLCYFISVVKDGIQNEN